jgi:hypothetical protein
MKLAAAEMFLAFETEDWAKAIKIMSSYFDKPFGTIANVYLTKDTCAPQEVNIILDGNRYVWEEYDGFWSRSSLPGSYVRIFAR